MNLVHLALAFLGATVAYFAAGFAIFAALPAMQYEYLKHPGVYRSKEAMMDAMPINMLGILVSLLILAVLYAKMYPAGGNLVAGLSFGALMGLFAVCTYALHNYALLNIDGKLTVYESLTYLLQWIIDGAAIGLIYKP